jgi:hypothetical protein
MQERLQALAHFLLLFEQPGFEFGKWFENPKKESGVFVISHYSLSDTAHSFVTTAYDIAFCAVAAGKSVNRVGNVTLGPFGRAL